MTNKIGWCDMTWNPCWGCRNHCEYCYARGIAKRFYDVIAEKEYKYREYIINVKKIYQGEFANRLRHFVPTFIYSQFNKKFPKNPQRIFVGSMSEIKYWELEWIQKVIEKTKQYPQHTFQFLTKFPYVYHNWNFPKNCWLGVTVTNNQDMHSIEALIGKKFISIEPILENIDINHLDSIPIKLSWVIIGAESGNRKGKIIPEKEWIEKIVIYCRDRDIPIYLKDSLRDIYPEEIKMFPEMIKC